MKKVLSVLGLIAIIGLTSPAFAGPHGPGSPGGHGGPRHHGHVIHAGHHRPPHMSPRHHHGGFHIHAGYPRHGYWRSYRTGYWGDPWCDYRLGWCSPYYPGVGVHIPMGGASFSVRF